jgi:hypothetical protein
MVLAMLVALLGSPSLALRRRYPSGMNVPLAKMLPLDEEAELDLPCPWCLAPTGDLDARCYSCGRRFG